MKNLKIIYINNTGIDCVKTLVLGANAPVYTHAGRQCLGETHALLRRTWCDCAETHANATKVNAQAILCPRCQPRGGSNSNPIYMFVFFFIFYFLFFEWHVALRDWCLHGI